MQLAFRCRTRGSLGAVSSSVGPGWRGLSQYFRACDTRHHEVISIKEARHIYGRRPEHRASMSRHAVACRAAALSFLVFAASWAFTPLTGSSSGGRAIGTSSRRALEEDQEERVPFKVPAAEGDYVVRIAQAGLASLPLAR